MRSPRAVHPSMSLFARFITTIVAATLVGILVPATPAMAAPVFGDGFETGDLSSWTSSAGFTVQQGEVRSGSYAIRNSGSTAWAQKVLPTPQSDVYTAMWFKTVSHSSAYTLIRLKTASGANIARVFVTAGGALAACNERAASCVTSKSWITPGDWYGLQIRTSIAGNDGVLQVWLDGHLELDLSRRTDLGTAAVGRLEIGNRPSTGNYDVVIDDVAMDTAFVPDPPAPVLANPTGVSRTADNRWWTNGEVRSIVQLGDTLFIGGVFTKIFNAPPGEPSKAVPVQNLAALDVEKGTPIGSWRPAVNGRVWALETSPDGDQLFVGGKFSQVGGQEHINIASLDPITGVPDATFDTKVANVDNEGVRTLLASDDRLYVGGYFNRIDGQPRNYLAALDHAGDLDPGWTPQTDAHVQSLTMAVDGQTLFACGRFERAAGPDGQLSQRRTVARFDTAAGTLDPWNIPATLLENPQKCWDVVATSDRLIGGFGFTGPNHLSAYHLLDPDGTPRPGDRIWRVSTTGDVQVIEPLGSTKVVFGGHFRLGSVAGRQIGLANVSNGAVDTSFTPLLEPFSYKGVWALAVTGSHVYAGGIWTTVNGRYSRGFARFPIT